jgi:hypothetical protein
LRLRFPPAVAAIKAAATKAAAPPTSSHQDDEDSYDLEFHGYDPDAGEQGTPGPPKHPGEVPSAASVAAEWLPPVGLQSMSNCFVWSPVYGLATFYAARKSKTSSKSREQQAGPDYAYIRYQLANKIPANTCEGGQITKCLDWLRSNGGTPSLAAAPNVPKKRSDAASCGVNWSD